MPAHLENVFTDRNVIYILVYMNTQMKRNAGSHTKAT